MKTIKMRCVMSNSSSFTLGEMVDTQINESSHLINVPSKGFATFSGWVTDTGADVHGVGRIIASFRRKNIKTDRKLIVRAMRIIARQFGWTDASVSRHGNYKTVKEWARDWADYYTDENGELLHDITEYLEDCSRGDAIREFMQAEIDAL